MSTPTTEAVEDQSEGGLSGHLSQMTDHEQALLRIKKNQERAERRRQAGKQSEASGGPGTTNGPPITERAALGLPEHISVGDTGLSLWLRAPVMARNAEVHAAIMQNWPDLLIFAVLADPRGRGIDFAKTADVYNRVFESQRTDKDGGEGEPLNPFTVAHVEDELGRFSMLAMTHCMQTDDPDTPPGAPSVIEDIAATVWELADGFNAGLTRAAISEMLVSQMRSVDFADLLRAVFRALDGADADHDNNTQARFWEAITGEPPASRRPAKVARGDVREAAPVSLFARLGSVYAWASPWEVREKMTAPMVLAYASEMNDLQETMGLVTAAPIQATLMALFTQRAAGAGG